MRNGPNRASFMWGSSTRNTRIEHLWVEVGTQFVHCAEFQATWNAHPMAGNDTFNKSPNDMQLLGQARLGIYLDECEGLHPETIENYYGVEGAAHDGQLGAGNPADEEEPLTLEDKTLKFDTKQLMFQTTGTLLRMMDRQRAFFFAVFADVVKQGIEPAGYGLLAEEWDDDGYPDVETLRVGRRPKKDSQILVSLAQLIWFQRARLWVQGLNVLSYFDTV
ncbi:hypothetical protein B0H14DRAFT_2349633 [Mycena olivaceomarginata]|nr:hypothetical protein B0H14DRAFT_2349633 [Mycena olivaceomarginata]